MPRQSLLSLIKRWKQYEPRNKWGNVPTRTRGVYVLYKKARGETYKVVYIGIAGMGPRGGSVRARLKSHNAHVPN